jgi:hypothetical protein
MRLARQIQLLANPLTGYLAIRRLGLHFSLHQSYSYM